MKFFFLIASFVALIGIGELAYDAIIVGGILRHGSFLSNALTLAAYAFGIFACACAVFMSLKGMKIHHESKGQQ